MCPGDGLAAVGTVTPDVECHGVDLRRVVVREVHLEGEVGVVAVLIAVAVGGGRGLARLVVEHHLLTLQVHGVVVEELHLRPQRHHAVGVVDHCLRLRLVAGVLPFVGLDDGIDVVLAQRRGTAELALGLPRAVLLDLRLTDGRAVVHHRHLVVGRGGRRPDCSGAAGAAGATGTGRLFFLIILGGAADDERGQNEQLLHVDARLADADVGRLEHLAVLLSAERVAEVGLGHGGAGLEGHGHDAQASALVDVRPLDGELTVVAVPGGRGCRHGDAAGAIVAAGGDVVDRDS